MRLRLANDNDTMRSNEITTKDPPNSFEDKLAR